MSLKIALFCMMTLLTVTVVADPTSAGQGHGARFAVISDPHLYSHVLGTTAKAFQDYLNADRKLIRESEAILDAAIDGILEEGVKFVLVPGDLTKDGERFNHLLFAHKMKRLERAGIQVFVVPGNHDVNNPHAVRYVGDDSEPIPSVSPHMFRWIYQDYGYRQAIHRDPHSLSYVAEPSPGLWLIAMDACQYEQNDTDRTGGSFNPKTLDWVLKMARRGKALGKQLIGMMHHGVMEHYQGQSGLFPEYVVMDWQTVSNDLALAGLQVVFTGHYHANDVTRRELTGGNFIFDIETGSLVTYPCPYRIVTLKHDKLKVESRVIEEIDYDTGGKEFPEYAEAYLMEGLTGIAYYMLTTQYGQAPGESTLTYARQLAEAFKAHYAGDENPSADTVYLINAYLQSGSPIGQLLGQYLGTLWSDLAPADTDLTIDLSDGTIKK